MKIHLIAIGGAVMHNMALALKQQGHTVTGSDDLIHEPSKSRLAAAGLLPETLGWFPERLHDGLDAVILGMHAHADNPELAEAKRLGLKIYSFPEYVYEMSQEKQRVVVAGSHGKTTVTSMLLHAMRQAGMDFDYLVGAQVQGFETMVRLTAEAPVIVIEGDEYPTSALDPRPKFLSYEPNILILTGVAWDHINAFPNEQVYEAQFAKLLASLPKAATVIYNKEDKTVRELVSEHTNKEIHYLLPYSTPKSRVRDGQNYVKFGKTYTPTQVYGDHNMANMAAAYEVLTLFGLDPEDIKRYLGSFKGAGMRMEHVYEDAKSLIVRDFAHAPSKVRATTEAVLTRFKDRNVIVAFELNTYSSLNRDYLPQYRNVFRKAKQPVLFISPDTLETKRMKPIPEETLRQAFHQKDLELALNRDDLVRKLKERRTGDDVFLLMSSGSFGSLDVRELVQ